MRELLRLWALPLLASLAACGARDTVAQPVTSSDPTATTPATARTDRLGFWVVAEDDVPPGLKLAAERERLALLLAAQRGAGPDEIDVTSLDLAFPEVHCRWIPYSDQWLTEFRGGNRLADPTRAELGAPLLATKPLTVDDYALICFEKDASRCFTEASIEVAAPALDARGNPCVGITLRADLAREFGDYTEGHVGRRLGIVLDGRLMQPPALINERLEDRFVIQSGSPAGFTGAEIGKYLAVFREAADRVSLRR